MGFDPPKVNLNMKYEGRVIITMGWYSATTRVIRMNVQTATVMTLRQYALDQRNEGNYVILGIMGVFCQKIQS